MRGGLPGTLVRLAAGGVCAVGGRVALARLRSAAEHIMGVRGSSSQLTALALVGGEGRRSRSTPLLSEITARPGDGGTESSTAIDGNFTPNVVFFLK